MRRVLPGDCHAPSAGLCNEGLRFFLYASAQEAVTVADGIDEETVAAIMTALKLFGSARHDRETEMLTILSIKRAYSPWNSKIHGLTQMPDYRK